MKRLIKNIKAWFQGNFRYWLFYNHPSLIRTHIREQIKFRIEYMDSKCYAQGSCKICGCKTTALQMADKMCDKPCYPDMLSESKWIRFKNGNIPIVDSQGGKWWLQMDPVERNWLLTYEGKNGLTYKTFKQNSF